MNELAVLVPHEIGLSFLGSIFSEGILGVNILMVSPILAMWLFNKKACKDHGSLPVMLQCFSRVALDIGLVAGIAGSAIGVVAMTITFNANSNVEAAVSIALTTMLWGGIFVGLGYFLHNPNIPINARISGWPAFVCAHPGCLRARATAAPRCSRRPARMRSHLHSL